MEMPVHPVLLDQGMPDNILIQRSVRGDRDAFESLIERYRSVLEGYVLRWCPDPHLVPDLVQGVWLHLYLALPTLQVDRSLRAWLMQVAHNTCVNELRRKHPLLFSQLDSASGVEGLDWLASLPDLDPSPEALVEQQECQHQLVQAIRTLPAKQRVIVWLRYRDQLSFTDIGRRLNLPAGTVRTTFARARSVLRRLLSEEASRASNW